MIRILLAGLVGYALYRAGRRFIRSVPADFEPIGLLPPAVNRPQAARRQKARQSAERG